MIRWYLLYFPETGKYSLLTEAANQHHIKNVCKVGDNVTVTKSGKKYSASCTLLNLFHFFL